MIAFLDLTLPTPAENLALDEALLLQAEAGQGGEVLRLWESPQPVVVLGSGGRLKEEVDEAACLADGVPILRRGSGGGTVTLGPGCLCFTLVLAYERSPQLRQISASYRHILSRVLDGLPLERTSLELAGTSDLTHHGRKFSGNAQQRKRSFLLHHGTLLYAFDLATIPRYLRLPPRQPDYRQQRDHLEFVANVPLTRSALSVSLTQTWDAHGTASALPLHLVERLMADKYTRETWNYGR